MPEKSCAGRQPVRKAIYGSHHRNGAWNCYIGSIHLGDSNFNNGSYYNSAPGIGSAYNATQGVAGAATNAGAAASGAAGAGAGASGAATGAAGATQGAAGAATNAAPASGGAATKRDSKTDEEQRQ